MTSCIKRTST